MDKYDNSGDVEKWMVLRYILVIIMWMFVYKMIGEGLKDEVDDFLFL